MLEADLYPPIKAYLEGQGYEVKAEIGDCDVMAKRLDEEPIIVELKRSFSLSLVMQGIERQALFERVYLAIPVSAEKGWVLRYKDIKRLCRRLGLGLLAVKLGDTPSVEAHLDPQDYKPRQNKRRSGRLLREFERRVGDPNIGGTTRRKRMTAYRQDALRCADFLGQSGPSKTTVIRKETGVIRSTAIMAADHYGWFERVERGIYQLTPQGQHGLVEYAEQLKALTAKA